MHVCRRRLLRARCTTVMAVTLGLVVLLPTIIFAGARHRMASQSTEDTSFEEPPRVEAKTLSYPGGDDPVRYPALSQSLTV